MNEFGAKKAHQNYCGIRDSILARLFIKFIPWLLTMMLQVYYMAEIYLEMKRRAVTVAEWRVVGKLFMYPFCAFIVNIFGILNFVCELTEPDNILLINVLVVMKNLLTGK